MLFPYFHIGSSSVALHSLKQVIMPLLPLPQYLRFSFCSFSYLQCENIKWKIAEVIHSSKSCTSLNSMMKLHLPAPSHLGLESFLCLAYAFCIHYLPFSHLVAVSPIRLTVVVSQHLCSSNLYNSHSPRFISSCWHRIVSSSQEEDGWVYHIKIFWERTDSHNIYDSILL